MKIGTSATGGELIAMNENTDNRLDSLFRDYRDACPDTEGSPAFTPQLWAKIDARRGASFRLRRLAQGFVSAAAAMCLAMSLFLVVPITNSAVSPGSYLEILDDEHETLAYADIDDDAAGDLNQ